MSTAPEGSRSGPEAAASESAPARSAPVSVPGPVANGSSPQEAAAHAEAQATSAAPNPVAAPPAAMKPVKKKPPHAKPTSSVAPDANESADEGAAAMAIAPRGGAGAARALRKKRARALGLGLAVWVGIPFVLSLIYYAFIARSEFESVAQLAVRGQDVGARVAMLREHIVSRDMLAKVEAVAPVSREYRSSHDLWTRFLARGGSEGAYQAFRHHVTADADPTTGIVTLRVRALSGREAQAIAMVIADESQHFLQAVGGTHDPTALAKARLADVEARLVALEQNADVSAPRVIAARREVLQKELESALRGLEAALHSPQVSDALVVVAKPSLPSEAVYPRRGYGVASVLFISLLLFGIGSLMIAAVREHAQF